MNSEHDMRKNCTNIKERFVIGMMCLSVFCVLFASQPEDKPRRKSSEEVKLIHSDVLYKNHYDVRADVLVGHVRLYHDGM